MSRIISETPERWVILKINGPEPYYRVFAGWRGGYTSGDSWRMNSGIVGVEEDEDYYYFIGHSGSCYKCHKERYGVLEDGLIYFSPWVQQILENIIDKSPVQMEILGRDTNFIDLLNQNIG